MGLGGTAKRVQKLADTAEKLYEQIKDLQRRMVNLEESVDESTERLDRLEVESEKQRVLLEAIAAEHDIDVETVLAEAAIEEAEPDEGDAEDAGSEDSDAEAAGDTGADDADSADGDATGSDSATDGAEDDSAADDGPTVVDEQGRTIE